MVDLGGVQKVVAFRLQVTCKICRLPFFVGKISSLFDLMPLVLLTCISCCPTVENIQVLLLISGGFARRHFADQVPRSLPATSP